METEQDLLRAIGMLDIPHDGEKCLSAWRKFSEETNHPFLGLPPGADDPRDPDFSNSIEIDGRFYDGGLIERVIEDGLYAIERSRRLAEKKARRDRQQHLEGMLSAIPKPPSETGIYNG